MKKIFRYIKLWTPPAFWCGLIFYLSSIPNLSTNLGTLDVILRKLAHIVEYGILAFLIWRAIVNSISMSRVKIYTWAGSLSILYAISDELHQSFVPTRGPSALDVIIDSIGVLITLWIINKKCRVKEAAL
ncbi:VanZ family protein [bacterium]|nr:VanZ family protein [bacterium]